MIGCLLAPVHIFVTVTHLTLITRSIIWQGESRAMRKHKHTHFFACTLLFCLFVKAKGTLV